MLENDTISSSYPFLLLFDIPIHRKGIIHGSLQSADKITLSQPNTTDHQSCILKPGDATQNNLTAITRAISITITALKGKRFPGLALRVSRNYPRF